MVDKESIKNTFDKCTLNGKKIVKVNSILLLLMTYTIVIIIFGVNQAIPRTVDNSSYSLPGNELYNLGSTNFEEGQVINIRLVVSESPARIIIISKTTKGLIDEDISVVHINQTIIGDWETKISPSFSGYIEVKAISSTRTTILTVLKINGMSVALRNSIIISLGITTLIGMVVSTKKRKKEEIAEELIQSEKKLSTINQIRLMIQIEMTSLNKIGLIISGVIFCLFAGNPNSFSFSTNEITAYNSTYSFDVEFIHLIKTMMHSLIAYLAFCIPVLLIQQIWVENTSSIWHEKSYPYSLKLRRITKIVTISLIIFFIPVFHFTIQVINTFMTNSTNLNIQAVILVIITSFLLIIEVISIYFIIFEFIPIKGIRMLFPFVFFLIAYEELTEFIKGIPFLFIIDRVSSLSSLTEMGAYDNAFLIVISSISYAIIFLVLARISSLQRMKQFINNLI
ncbi:MAG: hypothetical protein KAR35_02690 [Candidatus Heimdallarchaeota archaeon]|nr:hypothetical protein [Candidatus Heimdallarchaeota archaeon]MCK5048262.1 hypothetical protein [Candidatus Heimdallarchaeota archaeon]